MCLEPTKMLACGSTHIIALASPQESAGVGGPINLPMLRSCFCLPAFYSSPPAFPTPLDDNGPSPVIPPPWSDFAARVVSCRSKATSYKLPIFVTPTTRNSEWGSARQSPSKRWKQVNVTQSSIVRFDKIMTRHLQRFECVRPRDVPAVE